MSRCIVLSGREVSDFVYKDLKSRVNDLAKRSIRPGLAAILVGENPASEIYIKMKTKRFRNMGMRTKTFRIPIDVKQSQLLKLIEKNNRNKTGY